MASKRPARATAEEHDQYPGVVLRWDYADGTATRIIESRCKIQWIVQVRKGTRDGLPIWRNRHFVRSRLRLECLLDHHSDEIMRALPDWFPEPNPVPSYLDRPAAAQPPQQKEHVI